MSLKLGYRGGLGGRKEKGEIVHLYYLEKKRKKLKINILQKMNICIWHFLNQYSIDSWRYPNVSLSHAGAALWVV